MSSSGSGASPWARESNTQGRRRVSLRIRNAREFTEQSSASSSASSSQLSNKRTTSPPLSAAKRMRVCEEEEEGSGSSSMGEERVQHDESIEEERDEDENRSREGRRRRTTSGDGDMQVTSSCSSSDDAQSLNEESIDEMVEMSEYEYERDDEEEFEDEDEEIEVDKTDIITSDEGEYNDDEQENLVDGPLDTLERMQKFRHLSVQLGQRFELLPLKEPNQLTKRCRGVGPASQVWSVLCHKDELHSICNERFMENHEPQRPITTIARATLIDWMQEVCSAEKLHRETFHLAIDYVDRFMAKGPKMGVKVKITSYQLVGTTALFLAAKYEEIYPPKVEEIVSYTDHACGVDQVRELEIIMLKVLEWELNVITPYHWSHLFLELLTGTASKPSSSIVTQSSDGFFVEGVDGEEGGSPLDLPATVASCMRDEFIHMACIMDTVILHDYSRRFTNRVVAAAVMYAIYDANDAIEQVTGLSPTEIREAIDWVTPIVTYCEKHKEPMPKIPVIEGIRPDVVHMIQLNRAEDAVHYSVDRILHDISRLREELLQQRSFLPPGTGHSTPQSRPAPIRLRNRTIAE